MKAGGKISIDINNDAQSVTASIKKMLGENMHIAPEDVQLLPNGWVRLKRHEDNIYLSPHAVESVVVEGGELPTP